MWEAIASNRRKSIFLIVLMGMLLVALGGSIGGAWGGASAEPVMIGVGVAGFIWFVLTLLALFQGKNMLLAFSGAREVSHDDAPQLYNIVEEMRIAASLPETPKVYIMEERAPNAFAVGTPENAGVAVTTGLLSILSRDELQGVIAHEIGHIRNLDSRFMTIAGVMMGTIVILSDVFMRSMFYGAVLGGNSRRRSSNDNGGGGLQMILMIVAIILAILAPILANLLYLACSRSREYLADASAAVFTRYPEGLASALEKISGTRIPLPSANRVTAPMYIIKPIMKAKGEGGGSLFSTHPPTEERVAILRNMGAAGLNSYNKAYKAVKGEDVIGTTTLRSAEELEMRGIAPVEPEAADRKKQTRAATDILHKLNKYLFLSCSCGVRIKVPPTFSKPTLKCPKCGKIHDISEAA